MTAHACEDCRNPFLLGTAKTKRFCPDCYRERQRKYHRDQLKLQPPTETACERLAEAERRNAVRTAQIERMRQRLTPPKHSEPTPALAPVPVVSEECAEKVAKLRAIRVERGATIAEERTAQKMIAELLAS